MNRKLVLIGAGSAVFTRRLVADLLTKARSPDWELALVDIDQGALEAVRALVEKIMKATGRRIPVEASADRRKVLSGADFVVSTIAVGGRRAWERDIAIPRTYGIFQPVGDTTMPGGISRAMRMIPATVAIAEDIEELCPGAVFINYSNPMSAICRAVRKRTGVAATGLCHGVKHSARHLADFLGRPSADVKVFGIGVNHLTYLTRITLDGEDAMPALREIVDRQRADAERELGTRAGWPNHQPPGARLVDNPFSWEIFREHGVFPVPMDRHVTEFFPDRFAQGWYYGARLGVDAYSFEEIIESGDRGFDDMISRARSHDPLPVEYYMNTDAESEELLGILESLEGNRRELYSVNLPNTGFASQFPRDCVLETTASAMSGGFVPLMADDLPESVARHLRHRIEVIECTVDAALAGGVDGFVEAIMKDGAVNDAGIARKLAEDLVTAHAEHLPQFAPREI